PASAHLAASFRVPPTTPTALGPGEVALGAIPGPELLEGSASNEAGIRGEGAPRLGGSSPGPPLPVPGAPNMVPCAVCVVEAMVCVAVLTTGATTELVLCVAVLTTGATTELVLCVAVAVTPVSAPIAGTSPPAWPAKASVPSRPNSTLARQAIRLSALRGEGL